jgi:mycothiol maleylpyruvate isomerase-like protein
MSAVMEPFSAFEYAIASTAEIIKGTAPDQASLPTPCTEWAVRDVISHVIGTLWLSEALFTGQPPRYPMVPGGLPTPAPDGSGPAPSWPGSPRWTSPSTAGT